MTRSGPVKIGVVGAGVISDAYLNNLVTFPDLEVVFVADLDPERAATQALRYGVPGHGSVDELLQIDDIEIVVNLTIPAAHVEVGLRVLAAGKNVWSEKPFALDRESARVLMDDARERGLRVACAPDTFLGAGLQSAQRILDSGRVGKALSGIAVCQTPGPDRWHPNPEFLFDYGAGPLFDLGPYYLTAFVQMFGPVDRVSAVASTARETRVIASGPRAGTSFPVNVPTQHTALIVFESGPTVALLISFESAITRMQLEITALDGTLVLPDPNKFVGATELYTAGIELPEVISEQGAAVGRGMGVLDLARSLRTGVPERASSDLASHVLDVMTSITESARSGSPVAVTSSCARPAPLPADWNPFALTLA